MNQIKLVHQRLADADSLPDMLAAGWDIFELIGDIASAVANESADLYPALTFARGSAVNGRNAIAFAASLPPASRNSRLAPPKPTADSYEIADALANLASALSVRMQEFADLAADPADCSACVNAAAEAARIAAYLAKEE